ncbi:UreF-domain-containing protein [Thelephora terrestris]|uniref:UreF-domain-containing protein n=1 Tax=Thelephora terrestris TaxID=56493 RepID=A0A9P6HA81_9AGAM|nr:UreF-domain-containing protein [Thelephora terrestris]
MDNIGTGDDETYLLLLLADSNLPTGSFVASAGLESFGTHGFCSGSNDNLNNTVNFIRDSVATYARSALPFVADAHRVVMKAVAGGCADDLVGTLDRTYEEIKALDDLYEAMTLNHVAKRASKSQGVALLTLHTKGFSPPKLLSMYQMTARDTFVGKLVGEYKLRIRREEVQGHLPICWGVLTAALNVSVDRSLHLHLFLHARSLLSAAVRLNTIGPYASQQLLLHVIRPIVDVEFDNVKGLRTYPGEEITRDEGVLNGPATTWPLGEILASRHDLQHSRIFNS